MKTEITDKSKVNGWVLYDADCRLCTRWAGRFRYLLARRHFRILPLQTPWIMRTLDLPEERRLVEMRLLRPDGRHSGGADALLEISRYFWWTWPLRQLSRLPGTRGFFRGAYRWLARRRTCARGVCEIGSATAARRGRLMDLAPLLILPWLALILRAAVVPWVFM